MTVRVRRCAAMTEAERCRWAALYRADPLAASPFLSPHFTATVAAVRDDVFVGILHDGDEIGGFFPFQRDAAGDGWPVAHRLSDRHGPVVAPGWAWEAGALVRGCGLRRWCFSGVAAEVAPFQPYYGKVVKSWHMDLIGGYAAYVAERRRAGSRQIIDVEAQRRRLVRERGALRFVDHVPDVETLHTLMCWKSKQYQEFGSYDRFAIPWVVALLERLQQTQTDGFAGALSALYAGDTLVAAHFGLRSAREWHGWFLSYNTRFARYSPGLILLLRMAAAAAAAGLERFELGGGVDLYKRRLANGFSLKARGCVEARATGK